MGQNQCSGPKRRYSTSGQPTSVALPITLDLSPENGGSAAAATYGVAGRQKAKRIKLPEDRAMADLEELNELETMEPASTACQDVISSTEGKPDPLLPITSGPENSSWDRWFQRVRSSRSNKWWASRGSDFS